MANFFAAIIEALGTFILTAVVISCKGAAAPHALAALVYAIGPISGCHVNPSVSIPIFIWKLREGEPGALINMALYIVAQLAGIIVHTSMINCLFQKLSDLMIRHKMFYTVSFVLHTGWNIPTKAQFWG